MTAPQFCYYADDFTGSTDALECLAQAGAQAVLFLQVPTQQQLGKFPDLDAFGVAGMTRSLGTEQLEREIGPVLRALRKLSIPHVHYKVCSTFDSSPTVGSIGRVIDVAGDIFNAPFVPLVVGAPSLGRYCVFGNLFARLGTDIDGEIHRLDRHPSMANHPVTPAAESDLRLHLAKQTEKTIALFDVLQYSSSPQKQAAALEGLLADCPELVLFDVLEHSHLRTIGDLLDKYTSNAQPLFSVGSSSIEMAVGAKMSDSGSWRPRDIWDKPAATGPLLVASGSRSPVTADQIESALSHGFAEVDLPLSALTTGNDHGRETADVIDRATKQLLMGNHTVIHNGSCEHQPDVAHRLAATIADVVQHVVERSNVRCLCIAGGDTSGYVAKQMSIESLTMLAPFVRGAPLCRASAPDKPADGLEVVFKGGQVGTEDFFTKLANPRCKTPRAPS